MEVQPLSTFETILKSIGYCFPMCGWYQVNLNQESINFYFGKYTETKKAGLHWSPCCFIQQKLINTGLSFFETSIMCIDSKGIPMRVNVNVRFTITDAIKFVANTNMLNNPNKNIVDFQTQAVAKRVFETGTYNTINVVDFRNKLQESLEHYAINIVDVGITDVSVADNVSKNLLIVQTAEMQAKARVITANSAIENINMVANQISEGMTEHDISRFKREATIAMMNSGTSPVQVLGMDR
jgi:regulator of protease activity HflC (stomatin/prohibitin superfamily)